LTDSGITRGLTKVLIEAVIKPTAVFIAFGGKLLLPVLDRICRASPKSAQIRDSRPQWMYVSPSSACLQANALADSKWGKLAELVSDAGTTYVR